RSAAILVAIGLVIGGIAAWSLGGTAKAFLFKIDVTDPRGYATAVGGLVSAALVAGGIPPRRAAGVGPFVGPPGGLSGVNLNLEARTVNFRLARVILCSSKFWLLSSKLIQC